MLRNARWRSIIPPHICSRVPFSGHTEDPVRTTDIFHSADELPKVAVAFNCPSYVIGQLLNDLKRERNGLGSDVKYWSVVIWFCPDSMKRISRCNQSGKSLLPRALVGDVTLIYLALSGWKLTIISAFDRSRSSLTSEFLWRILMLSYDAR